MNSTWTLAVIIAVALFAEFAPVVAQKASSRPSGSAKADKHDIKMDKESRAAIDRWEKMEYHLGREGVKTLNFKVHVVSEGPLGEAKATGTYAWDGKKGKLTWDNTALGGMLATRGWSKESFDKLVIGDSHRRGLKGATLAARKIGDTTVLDVKGETTAGYKSFQYDKNGVARQFTMTIDDPAMGKTEATIAVTYEKIGGKHVRNGWAFGMDLPMGKFRGRVQVKNKKVGRFWVYGTVEEKLTMRVEGAGEQNFGTQTLTFTDYKINGAIKEKAATPTSQGTKPGKAPPGVPAKGAGKPPAKATSRPKEPPKK